jgi:hypothetical protein
VGVGGYKVRETVVFTFIPKNGGQILWTRLLKRHTIFANSPGNLHLMAITLRSMRYALLLLAVGLLLASLPFRLAYAQKSREVTQLPPPAKRFALLIGIGKYREPGITPLDGPTHDVEKLKTAVVTYVGVDPSNVLTLTSDATNELELPTKDNIMRKLNYLNLKLGGGLLLVGFSGHGIYKFHTPFLLTYETVNGDMLDLTDTAASVSWLRRKLQTINAKQIILLLDACQNDPQSGKGDSDNNMSPEFKAAFEDLVIQPFQASAVLYATRPPERAYINDDKYGFFSAAFAEAVSGMAEPSNHQPPVTLGQVINYVDTNVKSTVKAVRNQVQEPSESIKGYSLSTVLADPSWIHLSSVNETRHVIHFQRVGTVNDCARLPSETKIQVRLRSRTKEFYAPASCDLAFTIQGSDETDQAAISLVNAGVAGLTPPDKTFDTKDSLWTVDLSASGEAVRISAFDITGKSKVADDLDFYALAARRMNSLSGKLSSQLKGAQYLSGLELVRTGRAIDDSVSQQLGYAQQSNSLMLLSGAITSDSEGKAILHLYAFLRDKVGHPTPESIDLSFQAENYRGLGDAISALILLALFEDAMRSQKNVQLVQLLREEAYLALKQLNPIPENLKAFESDLRGME